MAAVRYYYSDTVEAFLRKEVTAIVGALSLSSPHDVNTETSQSWVTEVELLRRVLQPYAGRGSVFFEYNIPRMGRRADVIAVIENVVFVIEFKTEDQKFTRDAELQVWDYALDLKNFQEGSRDRVLVPILVAPNEKNSHCRLTLKHYADDVYEPLLCNENRLPEAIENSLATIPHEAAVSPEEDVRWAKSGYEPTPTIIEAAVALYKENTVEDLTKHTGDIETTAQCIDRIIDECRELRRKAVCFVTGVPGAGKTLIGLQTAIEKFNENEKAVYLSGNFPLVEVLQEALTRDYIRRQKEEYRLGIWKEKPLTKEKAKSEVKAFIQMIHHYRDTYLEGMQVAGGRLVCQPEYFVSHADKAYVPTEHVAIFDEAQRAWTKKEIARFMKEKKRIHGFPYSEPEFLISCMDRHDDWGVVICLIGGGQEINKGEAGIEEWISALNLSFPNWHVYMSDHLTEKEYADGKALEQIANKDAVHIESSLHLAVSMRSFRAEKLSLFVHQLLELDQAAAAQTLKELDNYPIVLTRSLDEAKQWLRAHARGTERYGLLASSKAERLKAISINVRYQPNFVHWFLEDEGDVRSSNALEDTLNEFKVQGLEIDWACVAWDADLRLNRKHDGWSHFELRSGTKWQNIKAKIRQDYQINAYRVLLTRARQGMVIVVPNGDDGIPPDETRKPEWYDAIYDYLKGVGIPELGAAAP